MEISILGLYRERKKAVKPVHLLSSIMSSLVYWHLEKRKKQKKTTCKGPHRVTPILFHGRLREGCSSKGEKKKPSTPVTNRKCPSPAEGIGRWFQHSWCLCVEEATTSSFCQETLLTISFPSFVFCHFLRCHHFLEGARAGAGLSRPIADDGAVLTRGPAASNHSNKGGCKLFLVNLTARLFHLHSLHHWVFKSDSVPKGEYKPRRGTQ